MFHEQIRRVEGDSSLLKEFIFCPRWTEGCNCKVSISGTTVVSLLARLQSFEGSRFSGKFLRQKLTPRKSKRERDSCRPHHRSPLRRRQHHTLLFLVDVQFYIRIAWLRFSVHPWNLKKGASIFTSKWSTYSRFQIYSLFSHPDRRDSPDDNKNLLWGKRYPRSNLKVLIPTVKTPIQGGWSLFAVKFKFSRQSS